MGLEYAVRPVKCRSIGAARARVHGVLAQRFEENRPGLRAVAYGMLGSLTSRREEPLDAHGNEPLGNGAGGIDPEQEVLLADSVGLALLVVLETLTPAERLAFVLHDMFAVSFDEIASIVGRSPAATRQLASRARRRVQADAGRWSVCTHIHYVVAGVGPERPSRRAATASA
jgi:sigma-70-like protein